MATSAFKSTTRRTPIGKSSPAAEEDSYSSSRSASSHRRSRSLSRFSRPIPTTADEYFEKAAAPRGRFVNMVRGSGFPEISLDDLAIQFLNPADRGRSVSRHDGVSASDSKAASVSQRRGRSVSRQSSRVGNGEGKGSGGGGRVNSESNSRRRRSVSVVRCPIIISDSESDLDHSQNPNNCASLKNFTSGNNQVPLSSKTSVSNHRAGLRRSFSQKDLKYHDGYSSHSSALTDDEGKDANSNKQVVERTIQAVYSQKKAEHPTGDDMNGGLYEAMRKELRNAVAEIRVELEQAMGKTNGSILASDDHLQSRNSDVHRGVSTIRRNYSTKLEQSEKRKQDLLAEIVLEEQRGRELSKIVKELPPDPKKTVVEKPLQTRKRSNDRSRMSRRLTEEAEKYFEDFISNVEDTDISSLDGERSDTSSTLGGTAKMETFQSPAMTKSLPIEMDGVVLPWLQWETSNDSTPFSCKNKEPTSTPKTKLWDAVQEATPPRDLSIHSISSRGSCSPGVIDGHSTNIDKVAGSKLGELESYHNQISFGGTRSQVDVDEYLKRQSDEDILFEMRMQQQRIHTGSLLLCNQMYF